MRGFFRPSLPLATLKDGARQCSRAESRSVPCPVITPMCPPGSCLPHTHNSSCFLCTGVVQVHTRHACTPHVVLSVLFFAGRDKWWLLSTPVQVLTWSSSCQRWLLMVSRGVTSSWLGWLLQCISKESNGEAGAVALVLS